MTNEQHIKNLIEDLSEFEFSLIRERLLVIFQMTSDDIRNNPDDWKKSFMNPTVYVKLNEKVIKHLSFEKV
jgi:hypothetical protein